MGFLGYWSVYMCFWVMDIFSDIQIDYYVLGSPLNGLCVQFWTIWGQVMDSFVEDHVLGITVFESFDEFLIYNIMFSEF